MAEHFAHLVRGSGPGLLLAHGGGGSIDGNFGTILDELARTHTVVGPDYPGSGGTPRSETPLDLDTVADALVRTAVDAGVERFTVLGYSVGTGVAVRAATRHPDRVTGLILTSGFSHPSNKLRLAADVWLALLAQDDRRLLAKYLTLMGSGERTLNALSEAELDASIDALAEFVPEGTPEHVELVASIDTRAELTGISVPTLVIATTADALASPALSRELAAGIPGARLTEIDAGHNIGGEAREQWLDSIQKFLSEIG
ncbi:alpha/beta hydrolase [Saccharothrix sp. AJ9571]|nr:alpha/beta hydrolase [Saccharothrix sp. AJ9571]